MCLKLGFHFDEKEVKVRRKERENEGKKEKKKLFLGDLVIFNQGYIDTVLI